MINITLFIKGKEKTFAARGVNLGVSYRAYDLYRRYERAGGDYSPELMEELEQFVVDCFGGAFAREQLREGYRGSAYRLFPNMLSAVVGYSNDVIANFPEPATGTSQTATA